VTGGGAAVYDRRHGDPGGDIAASADPGPDPVAVATCPSVEGPTAPSPLTGSGVEEPDLAPTRPCATAPGGRGGGGALAQGAPAAAEPVQPSDAAQGEAS
jgi:hypothetical protein